MISWIERLRNCTIAREPALPQSTLGQASSQFRNLPDGASVCIKVSAANDLPYPFAVSGAFTERVIEEMHAANPTLRLTLTEGGVGSVPAVRMAARHGLAQIPGVEFIDAEACEPIYVPNPSRNHYQADGFWLPSHWVRADFRVLLTTCKVRSHHFQRWYSGGTRNLIGLLPRSHYKASSARREMRSVLHQRGMDEMVADLYATTGHGVLTILDGRLLAREDEHLPVRFTRACGRVLVCGDPAEADREMTAAIQLSFVPKYLDLISQAAN